ncbi:MAG: glutamate racemase [Brachymonas sp.]|nr:glutamate racemase [Brachymonas sp.]
MSSVAEPLSIHCPIGVFDSGVGGLSVLRQLLQHLPQENKVYLADSAWSPYGERSPEQIALRSLQIAGYLQQRHRIKALVVACNTATSQAVQLLREQHPQLLLIGIEPAIKPAVALSKTGHIGIMATRATVQSAKFARLVQDWGGQSHIHVQACDGLALAIENALDGQSNPDGQTVQSLCQRYWRALQTAASQAAAAGAPDDAASGTIDALVLGCTHYPFAADVLQVLAGEAVQLIEPGGPVARQTQRLLQQHGLLRGMSGVGQQAGQVQQVVGQQIAAQARAASSVALSEQAVDEPADTALSAQMLGLPEQPMPGRLTLLATSNPQRLQKAAQQWLGVRAEVEVVEL